MLHRRPPCPSPVSPTGAAPTLDALPPGRRHTLFPSPTFSLFPWPPRDYGARSMMCHHRLVVKGGCLSTRTASSWQRRIRAGRGSSCSVATSCLLPLCVPPGDELSSPPALLHGAGSGSATEVLDGARTDRRTPLRPRHGTRQGAVRDATPNLHVESAGRDTASSSPPRRICQGPRRARSLGVPQPLHSLFTSMCRRERSSLHGPLFSTTRVQQKLF